MQLESLANELLLDLFEFLSGVHLLRAFRGLNSRFNNLLFTHFGSNPLDFRFVSKTDFDLICQQHLPSILDQITSFCLSDDDETPQQTKCFLAHNLSLSHFTYLQSLSISHIYSQQTMDEMIDGLSHLTCLLQLSIISCHFRSSYVNSIWHLPRLIRCNLDSINEIQWIDVPIAESCSLQNLSILYTTVEMSALKHLLASTPCLRQFAVDSIVDLDNQQLSLIAPSIRILKLSWKNSAHGLENILQHVPNIFHLTIETNGIYVDGYRWEKMITDYLLKLKVFRLLMKFNLENDIDSEEEVEKILDTFRTCFWINDHQWFVRCHWKSQLENKSYCLYTLPYAFPWFIPYIDMRFRSTSSYDNSHHLYDRVHYVSYGSFLSTDFLQLHFSSLYDFGLQLPIEDKFWSVLPSFDRLTSLIVSFSADDSVLSQLQVLLDRAPYLRSLYLHKDSTSHVVFLTSKSIRRLYLRKSNPFFNEQRCIALSNSPLGVQCQALSIEVEDRTNIIYLANNMKNLQALNIQCKDDLDSKRSIEDELVEWLQQRLPTTCLISRDRSFNDSIKLWIR